ncbi:MAG: sulfotransferase family protein [Phycisphaerales bacterium]|nr:sulfotransferase family protein [Phycisphaerales bacterium]
MTLQIIGAGFGRTGTASLKLALEQIGFGPCYHMSEVVQDPARIDHWLRAAEGRPDWGSIFRGYRATVDFPSCTYYRELAAAYPDAKVILTSRDPGRWFDSVHATIMSPMLTKHIAGSPFGELNRRNIWRLFDERLDDREHMIACFERHVAEVRAAIPAERLLVYEVREGWGPLCRFLGVAEPGGPFPHVNTTEETAKLFAGIIASDASVPREEQLRQVADQIFKPKPPG